MSTTSLNLARPAPGALPAPGPITAAPAPLAGSPKLLVMTCLLVAAATIRALRVEIGGLFVPLHVVPIILAIPTVVLPKLGRFPRRVRSPLLLFLLLFSFSALRFGESFGDLVKMATSVLTIFAIALMTGTRKHFTAAVVGLCIALIIINLNGIRRGYVEYVGYMPLGDLANKNAYSLYALPIVLFAAYALIQHKSGWLTRGIVAGAIVSTAFVLFTGANRSGWGGMLLIGALLAAQLRRWRTLAAVGGLVALSYGALAWLGTSQTLDHRIQQTREGYSSDEHRKTLFITAIEIAIENPLFGITPQELHYEMARRLGGETKQLDTHNFIAYIVAGSGFPALLALLAVGLALWRRPPGATPAVNRAHDLVRMLCVVFVVRGLFSREVFFVGPFPIALGLAIGLVLATQSAAEPSSGERSA